jgi:hypothetical protein
VVAVAADDDVAVGGGVMADDPLGDPLVPKVPSAWQTLASLPLGNLLEFFGGIILVILPAFIHLNPSVESQLSSVGLIMLGHAAGSTGTK